MNYGFIRTAAASLKIKVADVDYNVKEIKKAVDEAVKEDIRLLVTPELSVTGYTCADLFFNKSLLDKSDKAVLELAEYTKDKNIVVLIGAPCSYLNKLYNCAFVLSGGRVSGIVPKQYIANYNEFYEKRWFDTATYLGDCYIEKFNAAMSVNSIFMIADDVYLGVEICEDLWVPNPPSSSRVLAGANIIANLSASDEYVSKAQYRKDLVSNQSARCICGYVYAGASVYESTTDLVFSGATLIAENGAVIAQGKRFSRDNVITVADIDVEKLNALRRKNMSFENNQLACVINPAVTDNKNNDLKYRYVDPYPFVPSLEEDRKQRCEEIFNIQAAGLAKRIEHVGSKGAVVGISGGLDSTLALLVCAQAMKLLGRDNSEIMGITMPGFGTTDRTYNNAVELMKSLGVTVKEISIKDACIQHLKDIEHNENLRDITYENTQARERTQILFDMANKHGKLLVGTGDLSELAMGWCTYNGDHMSMYAVNASVPKTLVRYLVEYVANISEKKTAKLPKKQRIT